MLDTIGVQLYTVRDLLPGKPSETLKALERIGFREVEVVRDNMERIWPSLQQTALKPVGLHLETPLFTREQDKLQPALEDAKRRGFAYVLCPYIDPQDRGGADMMKRLAADLNKAGEKSRRLGLSLCYHNHAFEFAPAGKGTLLDVLLAESDPNLVGIEFDIMWSQVAGVDPVSVLEKYGSRVKLMHLKNVLSGQPKRYDENVPEAAFAEVGKGVIDVPRVLAAAKKAGVRHYFVEQDHTAGDPLVSLRGSFEYLQSL
jgi:sugar phosphate isomerase/epimerase